MSPPAAVLAAYPFALGWEPLVGGYSGAAVWRGVGPDGVAAFALKAWPPGTSPARLAAIHAHLDLVRDRGCGFVPVVALPRGGGTLTLTLHDGRAFDVTEWVRGTPELATAPTAPALFAAGTAVARFHRAGGPFAPAVPPALERRRLALAAPVPPTPPLPPPVWAEAADCFARHKSDALQALLPWLGRIGPTVMTVGDLRAEHLLFDRGKLAGIIDYGALKPDHPAADLARLWADLPDDRDAESLLAGYAAADPPVPLEAEFVRALAYAGQVGALGFWLARFAAGASPVAAGRLAEWARRVGRNRFAPAGGGV